MSELFTPIHPNLPKSNSRFEPTSESIGGRFSEMPLPANEEQYDRPKKSNEDTPSVTEKIERESSKYLAIALDGGLESALEAGKHDAIEKWLIKNNYLKIEGDRIVTSKEKLISFRGESRKQQAGGIPREWTIPFDLRDQFELNSSSVEITGDDYFTFFNNRLAYVSGSNEPVPMTTLPHSFPVKKSDSYPECFFKPWEMPLIKRTAWQLPLILDDGTATNIAELHIASIVRDLDVHSVGNGKFSVTDPETTQSVILSTDALIQKYFPAYGSTSFYENEATGIPLKNQPANFAQKYLRNLDRLGILKSNDFRKLTGSFETSVLAPSDRRLSQHSQGTSLQTPGGKTLVYYLGRDKIVGTDIPFDKDNTVLRYLDNRTVGIVRLDNNFEEILCTFPLATPEEVTERRKQTKERFLAEGRELKDQELGARTVIGAHEMKQRMHPYKITDYLPQLPHESPSEYASRVARLSDARLISKEAREFFQRSSIGLHQLPWAEQLAASSILLDPRFKKEEIAIFCEQFGIDGLRTFIASTFGSNINKHILDLGAKSPELAQATFEKFGEIFSAVDTAKELVQTFALKNHKSADETSQSLTTIENQLLYRAKALLEEIVTAASQTKRLSPEVAQDLTEKLEAVRSDIVLLTTTFKTLRESGHEINMSDFQDSAFPSVHGAELPLAEVSRMRSLYADSMQGYPEATKQELLADFDRHISDVQSRFSLLRYKGEIAGFLCFTENQPGQKYVSAVTLDPRFQKAYIGEAMIDEAFAREASENILGADCVAQKSVSARYIENGFIGVRSWDDKGDLIMDIVRDDRRNEKYFSTKALSQDEIIKLAPLGRIGTARVEVVSDPKEHAFSLCNEGFVLTRYFKDPASKKWYLVYEPKPTKAPETESISHQEETLT